MKCVDVEYLLDELVDGSLPEKRRAEVLAHLDSCESCREAERSLRALVAEAASLDREIEPPRDLWAGIAERVSAEPVSAQTRVAPAAESFPRRSAGRRLLPYLAAAAALAIGFFGSLALPSLARDRVKGVLAYAPRAVPASFKETPGLAESQAGLEAARAELYAALGARSGSLSRRTLDVIEKNLRIIDDAAEEIEEAIEKDPGNPELSAFLLANYESEIRMLRQAALQPGGI
jgi:hypothetical protein